MLRVPVDADPAAIRGRFRSLVKAVHPDRTVLDACIDIGTLAEAKDRLLLRAEARIARDTAARAAREDEARQRLDAMRRRPPVVVAPEVPTGGPMHGQTYVATAWTPKKSVITERFVPGTPVGLLVDLAG